MRLWKKTVAATRHENACSTTSIEIYMIWTPISNVESVHDSCVIWRIPSMGCTPDCISYNAAAATSPWRRSILELIKMRSARLFSHWNNYFKQVTKNGQNGVMSSGFPGYSQASKLLRVFESWVLAHVLPSLKLFGKDWDKVYHTWATLCYALLWLLWIRFNYGIRFLQRLSRT